jgi:hypothetical protein
LPNKQRTAMAAACFVAIVVTAEFRRKGHSKKKFPACKIDDHSTSQGEHPLIDHPTFRFSVEFVIDIHDFNVIHIKPILTSLS